MAMTVIDCLNIAGAKAPIAPVLNKPLPLVDTVDTRSLQAK